MPGNKGGSTNTTTTQSGPPPQVLQNYQNLTNAATGLAGNPLTLYGGPMVAGFTPMQQSGFAGIENAQGISSPYIDAAARSFGQATTPLWPTLPQFSTGTVNQFQSPYTTDVTNALTNLYNNQNATQLQQVRGNATSAGAYGGDREAVAEALTAGQQQLSEAPTLAQVQQQGYQTALGEFNTQQQQQLAAEQANAWLNSQAGFGLAGLGSQAQNAALTGANALLTGGGLQQQLAQEQINVPYQQFTAAQAYPYQTLGFLAPLVEGTGSLSGGTGSTTAPGQSYLSQAAGLGLTGLGVYGLGQNLGWWGNSAANTGGLYKRGGRIGLASGGIGPVGIGSGVPDISLSYIPQQSPSASPSSFGLSVNQPQTSVTSTGSGSGGSGLSDIMGLVGLANLATKIGPLLAAARGGRIGFDDGGTVSGGLASPIAVSPNVQTIALDRIIHPGPAVKGSGPPHAPAAANPDSSGFGAAQGMQFANTAKGLAGLVGNKSEEGLAAGGRAALDTGGESGQGSVPLSVSAAYGGAPPQVSGALQQLAQLPLNRLQEMAVQYPPTTQQGQLVQMAIRQKQATPGAGTAPAAPVSAVSNFAPTAASPQTGTASIAQQPQDYGGTSHAMAAGGDAGDRNFVTEDELDPQPVVDHSGDTIRIRYPSEGKVLDLGLPSMKPRKLAAGGASGMSSVTAPNGVSLPQLGHSLDFSSMQTDPLTGQAFTPGGGSGNWFQPLAQYQPPGMSNSGPAGSMVYPSFNPYTPNMAGVAQAFGITPNQVFGGPAPSSGGGGNASGQGSTPTLAQLIASGNSGEPNFNAPAGSADFTAAMNQLNEGSDSSGGSKRGGRIGFDDGGDVGDEPMSQGLAAPASDVSLTADTAGLAAPLFHGTDTGEPSPPAAMATADRQPPGYHVATGMDEKGNYVVPKTEAEVRSPNWNAQLVKDETATKSPGLHGEGLAAPAPASGLAASSKSPLSGLPASGPLTAKQADAVLPLIKQYESGNRNIFQTAYKGAPGEINPSTGTHTAPSTAQGYEQIVDSTWRPAATAAGVDVNKYPHAMDAPESVQDAVAKHLLMTDGLQHWVPYNRNLAAALGFGSGSSTASADLGRQARANQVASAGVSDSDGLASGSEGAGLAAIDAAFHPSELPPHRGLQISDYSIPLLVAGLSTLGSRSPNALPEGFRAAAPFLETQQRAITAENEANYRNSLLGIEAAKAAPDILKARLLAGALGGGGGGSAGLTTAAPSISAPTAGPAAATTTEAPSIATTTQAPATNAVPSATAVPTSTTTAPSSQNPALTDPQLLALHHEYQAQVQQIDQQIETVQRHLSTYDTPQMQRLALVDSTIGGQRNALLQQLSGLQERRLGYVTGDPYSAAVAAGAKSAQEAYASLGPKALVALLERAGQVQQVAPGHIAVTGLTTFPPEIQQVITGALKNAGINVTSVSSSSPAGIPATSGSPAPTSSGAVQPGAPPPVTAPFSAPADLPSDPTLNQPATRLVPAPGGGVTAAPTLPGLPELQAGTGKRAEQAQKDIPELAKAEAGLDAQHQEIIAATANDNFYTPGAFSDTRKRIGTVINTVADLAGAPAWKIDEQHLGDATAIDKAAFGLATQAVHGISSRPSQLEFGQSRNAVPSNDLPAFSAILLSNTLRFQNQYQKGQAEYELQQYKNGADPSAAATAWQAANGNRVAGAALAQTYIDLAKARPNDPTGQWVNRLLSIPDDQRAEAIKQFDQRFTPLSSIDSKAFDVPSWGTLITQLGAGGG